MLLGANMNENVRDEINVAYHATVDQIAKDLWKSYGLEAYKYVTEYIKYSSWVVANLSQPRRTLYGDEISSLGLGVSREDVLKTMKLGVDLAIQKLIHENHPVYWQIKFPLPNRYMTTEEVDVLVTNVGARGVSFNNVLAVASKEEAIECMKDFQKGYLAANMPTPEMQLIPFNINRKEIPQLVEDVGGINYQNRSTYAVSEIPDWCVFSMEEHSIGGGCWGILYGEVAKKGIDHCKNCEYCRLYQVGEHK
jgi:hypothetical protein